MESKVNKALQVFKVIRGPWACLVPLDHRGHLLRREPRGLPDEMEQQAHQDPKAHRESRERQASKDPRVLQGSKEPLAPQDPKERRAAKAMGVSLAQKGKLELREIKETWASQEAKGTRA